MSQGLCPNLTKKVQRKCPKWPIVNCHALCYIGGLSVNLNHLKTGFKLIRIPLRATNQTLTMTAKIKHWWIQEGSTRNAYPLLPSNFSFQQKSCQIVSLCSKLKGWRSLFGKSWIRHCEMYTFTQKRTMQ